MALIRYVSAMSDLMPNTSMHSASGNGMTKSHPGEVKVHPKIGDASFDRARAFLRNLYPTKTADEVAADTGISHNTINSWLKGGSSPGFMAMVMLIGTYGPDFLAAVLPNGPSWLDRAVRAERQAHLEAEQARITRELEGLRR